MTRAHVSIPPAALLGAIAVIALLGAPPSAGGAQATTDACPPAVPQAPMPTIHPGEQLLACVASRPISVAVFAHWMYVAHESEAHTRHRLTRAEKRNEVMSFLISSNWILEEARMRGITVSNAAVRRAFERIRKAQFRKRGEFTKFLRQSGQTTMDLLLRVKLNLLSQRIQQQVLAGVHGATAQRRALTQFVREFKSRWQAQTYCQPAYAVSDCGHVQSL